MTLTTTLSHALSNAPLWLAALLLAGLALHILGGTIGIVSGYAAVAAKKGADWHRSAGLAFLLGMLVMSSAAVAMAVPLQERSNTAAGFLAGYLVITGWLTVQRPPGAPIGMAEKVAFVAIAAVAVAMSWWAVLAYASPTHALDGFSWVFYAVFGTIATAIAATDLRVIARGSLSSTERIRRHLWRMCFAFFFASGSFFLGQQKVMPPAIQGSPVLWLLGLAPLGIMVYWLIRTRRRKRPATVAVAAE